MCVCNRDGGVMGVAEGRMCKMCVCNRGTKGGWELKCYAHTSYTLSFCGHPKSTHKYNIDGLSVSVSCFLHQKGRFKI